MNYPPYIALEVTNHCFMKCLHCPHGHGLIKKKGFMDSGIVSEVLEEVRQWQKKPEIILYGNGEPLLHKEIISFVRSCSGAGLKSHLSTNVMLASGDMAKSLSEAGLTLIKLSFWGDNRDEYESRTKAQSFKQAVEKAIEFIEMSSPGLKIAINVVKYRGSGSRLEPDPSFQKIFEGYENVQIYSFYGSDWRGTIDIPELTIPKSGVVSAKPCHLAGDMITIAWDGQFSLCWLDYKREFDLGKRFEKKGDLMNFWRSDIRKKYMDLMQQGLFSHIDLCTNCSAPYTETEKPRYFKDSKGSGVCRGTHIFESGFPTNRKGHHGT